MPIVPTESPAFPKVSRESLHLVENMNKGADVLGKGLKKVGPVASDVLFGEEGRIPLAASLRAQTSWTSLRQGAPGPFSTFRANERRSSKLLAGVPVVQLFKAFGRKIGQSDDVAEAFA